MPPTIRLSEATIHFARLEANGQPAFHYHVYHVRPQASLTANLREAMQQCPLPATPHERVEVLLTEPVTVVPLAEFQEEDCEALYECCYTPGHKRRVFYDTVPAANVVLLFALSEATCRTLEDCFGSVRYTSASTALLQHFARKGLGMSPSTRLFVYTHEGVIDVAVFSESRLITFNTYTVRTLTDVAYYTFNLARHLGLPLATMPIYVAGTDELRTPVVGELQKYAARVFAINQAAEFNRHPVATTPHIPYDLITKLL